MRERENTEKKRVRKGIGFFLFLPEDTRKELSEAKWKLRMHQSEIVRLAIMEFLKRRKKMKKIW